MLSNKIQCTYVSQKVSKVRWNPDSVNDPISFVTGGWNDDKNSIRLWELCTNISDDEPDVNPVEIRNLPFSGNVTELKFASPGRFVVSSSLGDVYLYNLPVSETGEVDICEEIAWTNLHNNSVCTSFAIYDNDIATVGEDGQMNLLTTTYKEPKSVIRNADSCSINCVEFLRYNELLTGNSRGLMKMWDLRMNPKDAQHSFMLNNEDIVAATSLGHHPTQNHILAIGDEQGTISFWDLRRDKFPLNSVTAHADAISELRFHPERPEHVFSCSESGNIFHWAAKKPGDELWYLAAAASKYEIFRLMPQLHVPINCLDVSRDRVLYSADNEAVYLIENISIYS